MNLDEAYKKVRRDRDQLSSLIKENQELSSLLEQRDQELIKF